MKSFKQHLDERCWPGYKPAPGKKAYAKGSCVKEEVELDKSVPSEEELAKKYKMSVSDIQDLIVHGTKVEMEHTDEKHVARKIALKHIGEKLDYYKKLKKYVEEREGDAGGADNPVFTKPKMMKVKKEEVQLDEKTISVRNAAGHLLKVASQFKDIYEKHGYKPVPGTRVEEVEQLDEYESKGGVYRHSAKYEPEKFDPHDPHKSRKQHDPGEKLSSSETNRTERAFNVHWGRKSLHAAQSKKTLMNVHKDLPEQYEADDGPLTEEQLEALREGEAWTRKEGQSESGGLNRKGIESYRRANPGSKLSMAVTTKPSKLKPGSKAANRRKSFCSRMGGMKRKLTSAKTARDPNSRINKALRKWNC